MRRIAAALILAGALAGCAQEYASEAPAMDSASFRSEAAPMSPQGGAAPAPTEEAAGASPAAPQPSGPAPTLYLAYAYAMGLELPSQRLEPLLAQHAQACIDAGPRLCQLVGSQVSGDPASYIEGNIWLRGEPAWLRAFMAGMENQASQAGGRITAQSTSTEDLTRAIVDTEARLRAQTALRDRLQQLLRERPGRLADLLEVERELARVQGDLDSIQSNLAVMRTRVSMSELTLSYRAAPRPIGSDTFEPLRQAFADFFGIIVGVLAAIVTIVAALIPILAIGIPLGWVLLRWRAKRGGRFFRKPPPPAAS